MRLRNLESPFSQLINRQKINDLVRFKSREQGGGESKLHEGQLPGMMSVRNPEKFECQGMNRTFKTVKDVFFSADADFLFASLTFGHFDLL
jgi:hypothetical protein